MAFATHIISDTTSNNRRIDIYQFSLVNNGAMFGRDQHSLDVGEDPTGGECTMEEFMEEHEALGIELARDSVHIGELYEKALRLKDLAALHGVEIPRPKRRVR